MIDIKGAFEQWDSGLISTGEFLTVFAQEQQRREALACQETDKLYEQLQTLQKQVRAQTN